MRDGSELTTKTYDAISASYAAKFEHPSENIDAFVALIPAGGRVLDAGCGPGTDAAHLTSRGFDVTGVDLSKKMLELARKKAPKARFLKADIRTVDLEPGSFDGIVASFSLIHVPKSDVQRTLFKFFNLLKPGGVLYISVQEGESKEVRIPEPMMKGKEIFLNIISEKELGGALHGLGFSTLRSFTRPPNIAEEFAFNKFTVIARRPK